MRFTIAFIIGRFTLHSPSRPPLLCFHTGSLRFSTCVATQAWIGRKYTICLESSNDHAVFASRFTLEWPSKMKSERDREGEMKVEQGIEQRGEGKEATPTYLSHETMWHITEHFRRRRQSRVCFALPWIRKHKAGKDPKYLSNVKGRICSKLTRD